MSLPRSKSPGNDQGSSPASTFTPLFSSLPELTHLTRRDMLYLSGAAITSLSVFGCGSGGGSSSSNGSPALRSEPTGNLTNQILQYSNSADRLSSLWQAQSDNINFMTNFTSTHRSRSTTSWVTYAQATYYGLQGIETIYELFARQFIEFDNIGYLGEKITSLNSLKGTNAINNPQWLLAMMERGQQAGATFGYILEVLQTNGLGALIQTVREITDPTEQIIFYGVLTEIFNGWVTKIAARAQYPVDPAWLLDVGDVTPVTNVTLVKELNRIVTILNQLPFGPGFQTTPPLRSALTRESIVDPKDAVPSIIGEILQNIQETLDNPKTVKEILFTIETDITNYTKRIDLNKTKLSIFLLRNVLKDIAKDVIKKVISQGVETWKGKLAGIIADCVLDILDKSIDLAKYFNGTILTLEVLPLAVVFATLTAIQIQAILVKLKECIDMIQKEMPGRPPPLVITGGIRIDVYPTPVRIPFVKVLTGETDQIRAGMVVKGKLLRRNRKGNGGQGLSGLAGKFSPPVARETVSGMILPQLQAQTPLFADPQGNALPPGVSPPSKAASTLLMVRTYEGVEVSMILLMIDLMKRFPDQLTPEFTPDGEGVSYSRSDLATLLRREAGSTEAMVPGITSAQLLCTAPGFIPAKNDQPEDLTTITSLATLISATSFSPGGNINVK